MGSLRVGSSKLSPVGSLASCRPHSNNLRAQITIARCFKDTRRRLMLSSAIISVVSAPRKGFALVEGGSATEVPREEERVEAEGEESYKTPGGVEVQELKAGTGTKAKLGDIVQIDYVCRRQNGYFIYSTVEGVSFQPLDVPTGPVHIKLGDPNVISGMTEALNGKKAGSKLRFRIPPELGYLRPDMKPSPPSFAARRQIINHGKEPLTFEVKLIRVD